MLPGFPTSTSSSRQPTHAKSLGSFLAELALDPPSSSADYAGPPLLEEDYLILSTVHSAKGLEWDTVHVIGASDGNFPSDMALTTAEGLEEERRLFYVALTRTRQTLAIYVPTALLPPAHTHATTPTATASNHGFSPRPQKPSATETTLTPLKQTTGPTTPRP